MLDDLTEQLARRRDRVGPESAAVEAGLLADDWTAAPVSAEELAGSVGVTLAAEATLRHHLMFDFIAAPARPSNLVGALVTAAANPVLAGRSGGPTAHELERRSARRFARWAGYPRGDGVYTTGGSQGNLLGVYCGAIELSGRSVRETGWTSRTDSPRVLCSASTHFSVERATEIAGLGSACVQRLPVDGAGRLRLDELGDAAMSDPDRPLLLVLNLGTSGAGAVDDVTGASEILARLPVRHWLHVDAAYGGAFLFSSIQDELRAALACSDSVTLDPVKVLGAPAGTGLFLTRSDAVLERAFARPDAIGGELWALGPEESRPLRALTVELLVRSIGLTRLRAELDGLLHLARTAAEEAVDRGMSAWSSLSTAILWDPHTSLSGHRQRVDMLRGLGVAKVGLLTDGNQVGYRLCFTNPATTERHVRYVVGLLAATATDRAR